MELLGFSEGNVGSVGLLEGIVAFSVGDVTSTLFVTSYIQGKCLSILIGLQSVILI